MALKYKTRRRLALLVLLIGLPLYILVAVVVVSLFDRPPIWLEFLIYIVLGIAWVLPLKPIFIGVGQADPDEEEK
jgi:predicted membrane channel-forming protein YqfA (hemolysin III family)